MIAVAEHRADERAASDGDRLNGYGLTEPKIMRRLLTTPSGRFGPDVDGDADESQDRARNSANNGSPLDVVCERCRWIQRDRDRRARQSFVMCDASRGHLLRPERNRSRR